MADVKGWIEGLPVVEVLCEQPNSSCKGHVIVVIWCKYCKKTHKHGSSRIFHEEYMARHAHCGYGAPHRFYQIHRTQEPKVHTEDGITAPVLDVVDYTKTGAAKVICPKCCKQHRHNLHPDVEYTLVSSRCFSQYYARQELIRE